MRTPKRVAFVVAVFTVVLIPFMMFAICVTVENSDIPRKILIVPEIFLFAIALGVAFAGSCVLRDSVDRWRQEDSPFAPREDPDDYETGAKPRVMPRCVNVAGVNSTDPRVDLDADCQFCLDPLSCDISAAVGVAADPGQVRVDFHVAPLMLCTSCRKAFHWKCLMQQFAHCTRHTLVRDMRCPNCRAPFIDK